MHLGDSGQRPKPKNELQSKWDYPEIAQRADAADNLEKVRLNPFTFDCKENLREDDNGDDNSGVTVGCLCESLLRPRSETRRGAKVPDKTVGIGDVSPQRRGPLRGRGRICLLRLRVQSRLAAARSLSLSAASSEKAPASAPSFLAAGSLR